MASALFYLFWALCATSTLNVDSRHLQTLEEDNSVFQKYVQMDKGLKEMIKAGVKTVLPFIMEGVENVNVSSSCSSDLFRLISDIRKLKLPAFKMLDATSKIMTGFLIGNIFSFGDYEECLSTTATRNDGSVSFKGEYCMVHVKPPLPKRREPLSLQTGIKSLKEATKNTSELIQYIASLMHYGYRYSATLGVCVPSGCSSGDINSIVKYIGNQVRLNATVAYCDQHLEKPPSTGRIIAIFFFSLFGLFCIIGTFLDYYARKKDMTFQNRIAELMLCFSIMTNFPKVISAKVTDKSFSFIFGIRALSLFYVILLHQFMFTEKFGVQTHMMTLQDKIPGLFFQILVNGFLTTEVFFFIGGLFHSYSTLKYMEKTKKKISYVTVFIHRLLRIYPPYLFTMLSIYIMNNAQGPVNTLVNQEYWRSCDKNWWHNLLFINNFFMQQESCMFHSWYMAADMQLFLIAMFTVPLFAKSPKKGVFLHLGILVAGLISAALWAWHKGIQPAVIPDHVDIDEIELVWNAYCSTFPHIAPYFAGVLLGYFLSTYKDFKISLVYRLIGWPVATVAFMSMLFMTQRWNSGVEATILESALYFSFSRLIFVLAVAWMIICCARGYGGILNYILSLKVWVPIARISYMMFLISPIIQVMFVAHLKTLIDSDDTSVIWRYFGDLEVSFLMSLAMVTVIESPFIALEKVIFRRKSTERTKDVENCNQAQVSDITDEKSQKAIEMENNTKNTIMDLQLKE